MDFAMKNLSVLHLMSFILSYRYLIEEWGMRLWCQYKCHRWHLMPILMEFLN